MTFREAISASVNGWSAMLCRADGWYHSRRYEIQITTGWAAATPLRRA